MRSCSFCSEVSEGAQAPSTPSSYSATLCQAPEGELYALAAAWGAYIVFGKGVSHLHAGHSVALGLSVAAISSAVPISLEMVALKRLPQEAFGIMTSMEPAVAALLGLLMLDERPSGLQWLTIACTMLAATGSSVTARHDRPKTFCQM